MNKEKIIASDYKDMYKTAREITDKEIKDGWQKEKYRKTRIDYHLNYMRRLYEMRYGDSK